MGASHHWYDCFWLIVYCLTFSSWCGCANIVRCVAVGHLFQCHVHPGHYSRVRGDCIECKDGWERKEQTELEMNRKRKEEKKLKDSGRADLLIIRKDKGLESVKKVGNKHKAARKPGKWHTEAPEATQPSKEDEEDGKGKGKGKALGTHKFTAQKKWRDGRAAITQFPH